MTWEEAQQWEKDWHGDCVNSYNEETKQYIYAKFLGLDSYKTNYYGQIGWDFGDRSILDLGCGPYSLLMKSKANKKVAIDPCNYPEWVRMRYKAAGVEYIQSTAEHWQTNEVFDEVLIYNCLQHTIDPKRIIQNALSCSKVVRLFEWVEQGISDGHIHDLHATELDQWLGGHGKTDYISVGPCVGQAYWGIFVGNHYQ
jgi:2-polyprenyl-3-methyl-5-hydroxy-6-metoxy-1,4-benzoquinol methylase